MLQSWNENVWELKFAMQYLVKSSPRCLTTVEDLPVYLRDKEPFPEIQHLKKLFGSVFEKISSIRESEETLEYSFYRHVIETIDSVLLPMALHYTDGNQTKAAKILGINRNTFRKKLLSLNQSFE